MSEKSSLSGQLMRGNFKLSKVAMFVVIYFFLLLLWHSPNTSYNLEYYVPEVIENDLKEN